VKPETSYRTWAEIDLKALKFNLRRLRSLHPRCDLIGVVKANAYGHGMFAVAKTLAREGVRVFAVTNLLEAETISRAVSKSRILLLSPVLSEEIPLVVKSQPRWMPTISNQSELQSFEKEARKQRKRVCVHVKLDTGMGRLGSFPDEALQICEAIQKSSFLKLSGIYSHLSSVDINLNESLRQLEKLRLFCQTLIERGISLPQVHFQSSTGALRLRSNDYITSIRPGLALYGVPNPFSIWKNRFGARPLKPVLTWKARVVLVRDLPKGATISYQMTFRVKKPMRIAVLGVGYADGVSRKLSNRGEVLIRRKRCKILGRVTMDMTIVDISKIPKIRSGETAVLIGRSGSDEITAAEFAEWAETSPYEILCNIGKRVVRVPV
jgi:alanine racemase